MSVEPVRRFWQRSLSDLYASLVSSSEGLTSARAGEILSKVGPNEPAPARRGNAVLRVLALFFNPLVIVLLIASLVSAILGDLINAAIIVLMVVLSLVLNLYQTYRSQNAANSLKQAVALTASARRDGEWREVPRGTIVPGDVIRLSAGDLVPADARLLESRDLHAQEAALTGESFPTQKEASDLPDASSGIGEATNSVFLGTSVVSGTAMALVVATGRRTVFGDIATRLQTRPPENEFERGIRGFSFLIMRTVFVLVLFILIVSLALRHDPLESLLFAVALAVGLTPEFLPMITSVTLAQGAMRMAKEKVIVKNLATIQNFGSIDILCSDKTGTLTSGEVALAGAVDLTGAESERVFELGYINSTFETGIKSPLDAAILAARHLDLQDTEKIDEVPFDFERRRLSVVVRSAGKRLLITKGAPESVLTICTSYETGDSVARFEAPDRDRCEAIYQDLNRNGARVLAVAFRELPDEVVFDVSDEQSLTLAGYLTFADPPLPDAADVIRAMREDGVDVKILTGDNDLVAKHVCSQVGLDVGTIVLGEQIDGMLDSALAHVAEQTTLFARVSPAQKNRIILALKSRKHVVGFMGDGINDAPSLHAADVGISVSSAVEVAKDAADIILLEPSLRSLHTGILEGRRAFGNVMKYLLMGTSSNFGNMFSMAAAAAFLPFLPMLPTQILLNNFLYDLAQVTIPTDNVEPSFIKKPRHWDIGLIRDFMLVIGPISSIYDFLTFFVLLNVFHASEPLFHTGWFVESLATQTLVIFSIRTSGNPWTSRPSLALTITTILVVLTGIALPFSPMSGFLGFVPLPSIFFLFLTGAALTYLLLVEIVKRRLMRRLNASR